MISSYNIRRTFFAVTLPIFLLCDIGCTNTQTSASHYTWRDVNRSESDLWGEEALSQPGGPSYAFFQKLLPPLRYVDANFREYPITLSAPTAKVKARLVSNGSSINARARQPDWIGEAGTPVTFYVGEDRAMFGADLSQLDGPKCADGYLPIVQTTYQSKGATYSEEVFASTDPALAANGAVLVKFTLQKASGRNYTPESSADKDPAATAPVAGVEAGENLKAANKEFDEKVEALLEGPEQFKYADNRILRPDGKVQAMIYPRWVFNPGRGALIAPLETGESAYMLIFTEPADAKSLDSSLSADFYQSQRDACAKTWNDLLANAAVVETPEAVVNNAWRASIIGNYMLINGDEMRYSQGNQYAKRYIAEGGDSITAMALWGQLDEAKKLMPAQFEYSRKGLEFHQAAGKLQMFSHYYQLSHDDESIKQMSAMWLKELNVILDGRKTDNGMFPREKYCGDIDTMVYSLNSNANCWRAMRDMSVILNDEQLATQAAGYRKILLDAIDHATRRDVKPPFVPIALSGEENPHDPIWTSTIGSYWNLMIEYVLASEVCPPDSQATTDILHYLQQKGGLCMGMLRARATPGNFWMSGGRINDLYGVRYVLTLLRRDEPDRALVSFYGKLAQGMARDTFIGCEGSGLNPVDQFGRQMYLPPNSAANSNFLQQLRYLLIQDYDTDDDGKPDTLRLCFATPRAWLADGKTIKVTNAPTDFGKISFTIQSNLSKGNVSVDLDLPTRNPPTKILLRLRLPDGAKIADSKDGQTLDISNLHGHAAMQVKVRKW
jgi:hypothetical protein